MLMTVAPRPGMEWDAYAVPFITVRVNKTFVDSAGGLLNVYPLIEANIMPFVIQIDETTIFDLIQFVCLVGPRGDGVGVGT